MSLPEIFITNENPDDIKDNYCKQFGINKNQLFIKNESELNEPREAEIKIEDIPF